MLSIGTLININNNAASPEFIINEKLNKEAKFCFQEIKNNNNEQNKLT